MTRTIPGGIDLSQDTTLAMCLQVTDRLGAVRGFTEHDRPLDLDLADGNGTVTYAPEAAFSRSAIQAAAGAGVGTTDLIGYLDAAGVSESAVFGGLFDSALVKLFLVDWTQPAAGVIWIEIGEFEETRVEDERLTVTFKSLLDRYNATQIGDLYEVDCIHQLGSQPSDIPPPFARIGCRVQLDPPAWAPGLEVLARGERNAKPTGFEASGSPTQANTVVPTTENGRVFEAQTGGTTGGSEPAWSTALESTTDDNGVTWVARQALRETVTVAAFSDQRTFSFGPRLRLIPRHPRALYEINEESSDETVK